MRIADAFREVPGGEDVSDRDFELTCTCGARQRLDEMRIDAGPVVTLYECARCANSIVGVLAENPLDEIFAPAPLTRRREQGGHRLRGYVIGSKVDLALRAPGGERDLLVIPATPSFFVQYRHV